VDAGMFSREARRIGMKWSLRGKPSKNGSDSRALDICPLYAREREMTTGAGGSQGSDARPRSVAPWAIVGPPLAGFGRFEKGRRSQYIGNTGGGVPLNPESLPPPVSPAVSTIPASPYSRLPLGSRPARLPGRRSIQFHRKLFLE
jgi:hypothetical protein